MKAHIEKKCKINYVRCERCRALVEVEHLAQHRIDCTVYTCRYGCQGIWCAAEYIDHEIYSCPFVTRLCTECGECVFKHNVSSHGHNQAKQLKSELVGSVDKINLRYLVIWQNGFSMQQISNILSQFGFLKQVKIMFGVTYLVRFKSSQPALNAYLQIRQLCEQKERLQVDLVSDLSGRFLSVVFPSMTGIKKKMILSQIFHLSQYMD